MSAGRQMGHLFRTERRRKGSKLKKMKGKPGSKLYRKIIRENMRRFVIAQSRNSRKGKR